MPNETITYISYGLALLIGGLCYLLVKRTADEYDRWYESPRLVRRLPLAAMVSVLIVLAAVILIRPL